MKTSFLPFVCLVVLGLLSACATPQSAATPLWEEDDWVDQHVDLVVYGLSCPLCATNLDQQVQRVPGVRNSWIDLDSGRVRVEVEEGALVDVADLARAVENAGFTLKSVETP